MVKTKCYFSFTYALLLRLFESHHLSLNVTLPSERVKIALFWRLFRIWIDCTREPWMCLKRQIWLDLRCCYSIGVMVVYDRLSKMVE